MPRLAQSVVDGIVSGHYDPDLDDFSAALIQRRKVLRELQIKENKRKFRPGTRVRLVGETLRPRKFVGLTGVIVDAVEVGFTFTKSDPHESFVVRLDKAPSTSGKRKWSNVIAVPANCVERIPRRKAGA
jgi:hypothetical protein